MEITKQESLALRGIAICIIVLHNIVHRIYLFRCNEFYFDSSFSERAYNTIFTTPYTTFISYWGWICVPLFVFLSGYGLQMKWGGVNIGSVKLSLRNIMKLYILMWPIYLSYVAIRAFIMHSPVGNFSSVVAQMTTLIELVAPNSNVPGVYWYYGMTVQMYILYAFCLRKLSNRNLMIISIFTFFILYAMNIVDMSDELCWIRKQCLGWIPVFSIGILAARGALKDIETSVWLWITFLILLLFFALSKYTWLLCEYIILVLFLAIRSKVTKKIWIYLGTISASIFTVHPILREFLLFIDIPYVNEWFVLAMSLLFLAATIITSIAYSYFYKRALIKLNMVFA